jgi:hypothetical protein
MRDTIVVSEDPALARSERDAVKPGDCAGAEARPNGQG